AGEVVLTADAGPGLVSPGSDGVAVEAEAPLGGARAALTEGVGDLGLEEAACMALEAARRRADQLLVHFSRGVHVKALLDGGEFSTGSAASDKLPVGGFSPAGRLKEAITASAGERDQLFGPAGRRCPARQRGEAA